ncbi:MAG: NAD(P)/FAD-dependent oxidoreductase, partial [Oscillospiraceae bacterium]|nr:NAD(P)/FAD-dependent oxidoreductase [Oscillospiraceae bacterium]
TRLGKTIIRRAGLDGQKPLGNLTQEDLSKVAALVKCFALDVEGVMGMDHAQVTAGGVPTSEFRADTLESRLALNVYATGEVLDIDGDCGGYNLQWAWSSGYLAGLLK